MAWTLALGPYILLLAHAPTSPPAAAQTFIADLDGDRRMERVVFTARRDPTVEIWRNGRRVCAGVPLRMHPWKLRLGDVIGDGRQQLVLGVHKPTRFFPKPHAGLFVYGFDGSVLVKRWLGSHLADPLLDFELVRPAAGRRDKVVALERRRGGTLGLTIYSWIGFGFGADGQRGSWRSARIVGVQRGAIIVIADGIRRVLPVR